MLIVAFSLFALVALMAFAIDVGKQLRATAEAQNAADAAALGGAGSLAAVPGDTALAEAEAILYAQKNQVMGKSVTLLPSDVTFPGSPPYDSINVVVHREINDGRNGAISTIFGHFIGVDSLEVVRDAMARAYETGGAPECLLPFGVPDLWLEPDGSVADPTDTYDPTSGDTYRSPSSSPNNYTGYQLPRDWGREVVVYYGGTGTYNPSWWGMWNNTNSTRGGPFQQQVTGVNCGGYVLSGYDQSSNTTPGKSLGPALDCFQGQGCGAGGTPVMDQDPNASWALPGTSNYTAAGCTQPRGCMVRNANGQVQQISASPRIRPIVLYHPDDVINTRPGHHRQVRITNFTGLFFDRIQGGNQLIGYVVGAVTPAGGGPPAPGVTTRAIQLVE